MTKVLLTGGLGFIGSHICIDLIQNNYIPIIVDNLSNSDESVLDKIEKITNYRPIFYYMDVCDSKLEVIFKEHEIYSVIHLAGLKSVSESISTPLLYFDVNINSTLNLLRCMQNAKCYRLIFSSSATVYGTNVSPISDTAEIGRGITNPYGQTKYFIEEILKSLTVSNSKWHIISLRYFNPVGAHSSGLIGESPKNIPTNLMPILLRNKTIQVFGGDYNTSDGSALRDYIHVCDLASAHIHVLKINVYKYTSYNIGTGKPTSVIELINCFNRVNNTNLQYDVVDRRPGDLESVYCIPSNLDWKPKHSIDDMCVDAYNFFNKKL